MSEYRTQAPHYSGDVVSIEDDEEELNRTPSKVIDEYYGGGHKGRRIWGSLFPFTGLQAFFQSQLC